MTRMSRNCTVFRQRTYGPLLGPASATKHGRLSCRKTVISSKGTSRWRRLLRPNNPTKKIFFTSSEDDDDSAYHWIPPVGAMAWTYRLWNAQPLQIDAPSLYSCVLKTGPTSEMETSTLLIARNRQVWTLWPSRLKNIISSTNLNMPDPTVLVTGHSTPALGTVHLVRTCRIHEPMTVRSWNCPIRTRYNPADPTFSFNRSWSISGQCWDRRSSPRLSRPVWKNTFLFLTLFDSVWCNIP